MAQRKRRDFWLGLVKSADNIRESPGYRYNFFSSFEEVDRYFTQECGSDWQTQPWAVEWIRANESERDKDMHRSDLTLGVIESSAYVPDVGEEEVIIDFKDTHESWRRHGRNRKAAKRVTRRVPVRIIKKFLVLYKEQRFPLRRMEVELEQDLGVKLSYERIRELLKEA